MIAPLAVRAVLSAWQSQTAGGNHVALDLAGARGDRGGDARDVHMRQPSAQRRPGVSAPEIAVEPDQAHAGLCDALLHLGAIHLVDGCLVVRYLTALLH